MNAVRRTAVAYRRIAIVHRWLGFMLFVVCLAGTASLMPDVDGSSVLERFAAVLALEAGGGGPVNELPVLMLITGVAMLGTILLVRGFVGPRRPFRAPRRIDGWVRLVHRLVGAAFTISLVVYLAARLADIPPGAVRWAWILLLLTVNTVGVVLFGISLAGRYRARRLRGASAPRGGRPETVTTR